MSKKSARKVTRHVTIINLGSSNCKSVPVEIPFDGPVKMSRETNPKLQDGTSRTVNLNIKQLLKTILLPPTRPTHVGDKWVSVKRTTVTSYPRAVG